MVLDSYQVFAQDVEAECGFHCRCDLVASNTDKTILKTLVQSFADWGSTADSWTDEEATAGGSVIEYCCIATLKQRKLALKYFFM